MKEITDRLWVNKNYNFYYLPILKNAHSWGKYFFEKNFDFKHQNNEPVEIPDYEKSIILFCRDPVSRWFSGAAQWFWDKKLNGNYLNNDYKIDDLMLELIFSAGKIDNHTRLQRETRENINLGQCWVFDVESVNFEKNLVHFLENVQNVKVTYPNLERQNIIQESQLKVNIRNQLKEAYNNNIELKKSLLDYLKWDIVDYYQLKSRNRFYEIDNT